MRSLAGLLLLAGSISGCQKNCGPSPVPKDKTVRLRGSVAGGITLVKMINHLGTADRTASVDGGGRYDFAWTGADLTGTWGERWFSLLAPASPRRDASHTTSERFHLRRDTEAPRLAIWSPRLEVESTTGGAIHVRFARIEGSDFQPIERYVLTLEYQKRTIDREGRTHVQRHAVEAPARPGEVTLSADELRRLLPGRATREVGVRVTARGKGGGLRLFYHSGFRDVSLPLPPE